MLNNIVNRIAFKTFYLFVYVMILFEIIYMATPFAVYFYSVYRFPLEYLNSQESTSWLVQSILPHFSEVKNQFINVLLFSGWPMVFAGFSISAVGFLQIYTAKFLKRGAVTGGIYSFIRHPQYAGWIISGFGMSVLWSRMIVWMSFVTMVFIYYLMARSEERECFKKYGDAYRRYFERTGMFMFKIKSDHLNVIPVTVKNRFVFIALIYLLVSGLTIYSGRMLRSHVLSQISSVYGEKYYALSVTAMDEHEMNTVLPVIFEDRVVKQVLSGFFPGKDRMLIYIMPGNWKVSEIGIDNSESDDHEEPVFNAATHGNSADNDKTFKKIVISMPVLLNRETPGKDILAEAVRGIPKLIVSVDLLSRKVIRIDYPSGGGKYGEIPVVMF